MIPAQSVHVDDLDDTWISLFPVVIHSLRDLPTTTQTVPVEAELGMKKFLRLLELAKEAAKLTDTIHNIGNTRETPAKPVTTSTTTHCEESIAEVNDSEQITEPVHSSAPKMMPELIEYSTIEYRDDEEAEEDYMDTSFSRTISFPVVVEDTLVNEQDNSHKTRMKNPNSQVAVDVERLPPRKRALLELRNNNNTSDIPHKTKLINTERIEKTSDILLKNRSIFEEKIVTACKFSPSCKHTANKCRCVPLMYEAGVNKIDFEDIYKEVLIDFCVHVIPNGRELCKCSHTLIQVYQAGLSTALSTDCCGVDDLSEEGPLIIDESVTNIDFITTMI